MIRLLKWISHEGASGHKHRSWMHPTTACILHYTAILPIIIWLHDFMISVHSTEHSCVTVQEPRQQVAQYVLAYALLMFAYRLCITNTHRQSVFYEYTWLCNSTLVVGSIGLYFGRPIIASAHCVAVGIDQILWYIDLTGWALSGYRKFPIGVAKYLTWPETTWATRITCTHHLWTIPVLLYAAGGMHALSFPLGVAIVVLNVCLSRWMTPPSINGSPNTKYLNINLSHEVWRDISISWLQINYDDPPTLVYLFRLLWRWQVFNFFVFQFLCIGSQPILGSAQLC